MSDTPLIVGAGPAGTAAAIALARAGIRATILERSRETGDALCGGFLSWRTVESLDALGIAADALNPQRINRVRLFVRGSVHEAPLPGPAVSVSRHRLDTLLLARAIAAGAAVERGVAVRAIEDDALRTADGATLHPATLFLASGKHDIRGAARPAIARGADPTLGLRTRAPATPALSRAIGDAVELHLFDRGYAGIALQEDGTANICMAVHQSRLDEAGDPARLFAALARESAALAERLDGAGSSIDAIANVPYGWRATHGMPGRFRLGDQAAVIPSLAGEGMGIAIASGMSAAQTWLRDGPAGAPAWQTLFARRAAFPVAAAGVVRAIAERSWLARPLIPLARATGVIHIIAGATRIGHAPA